MLDAGIVAEAGTAFELLDAGIAAEAGTAFELLDAGIVAEAGTAFELLDAGIVAEAGTAFPLRSTSSEDRRIAVPPMPFGRYGFPDCVLRRSKSEAWIRYL